MEIKLKECLGLSSPEAIIVKLGFRGNSCLLSDYCCPVPPYIKLCSVLLCFVFVCFFVFALFCFVFDPDKVLELLGTLEESSRGGFFSPNQQPFQLCALAFLSVNTTWGF